MTVQGPLAPAELGVTLTHEHILADFNLADDRRAWEAAGRKRPTTDKERELYAAPLRMEFIGAVSMGAENKDNWILKDENTARAEITEFAWHGGKTLVDLTSGGLAPDPAALKRLSQATGVHIVAGTGWYQQAWVGNALDRLSVQELTTRLERDLMRGMAGTDIRAGIIGELSAPNPKAAYEKKILQAAARASRSTGAAISLSIAPNQESPEAIFDALDLLQEAGADLSRVAVGHANGIALDMPLMLRLLKRGVYLQFDRLGRFPHVFTLVSDHDVAIAILDLVKRGYLEQILLSQDVRAKIDLKAYGGSGYAFIPELYVPYLKRQGMTSEQINTILVANPRRLLTLAAAKEDRS